MSVYTIKSTKKNFIYWKDDTLIHLQKIPDLLEARKFSAELVNVKKSLLSYKHSTVRT
jgi:hypothetical protein